MSTPTHRINTGESGSLVTISNVAAISLVMFTSLANGHLLGRRVSDVPSEVWLGVHFIIFVISATEHQTLPHGHAESNQSPSDTPLQLALPIHDFGETQIQRVTH